MKKRLICALIAAAMILSTMAFAPMAYAEDASANETETEIEVVNPDDPMFEIAENPTDSAACVENGKIQLVFEGGDSGTPRRIEQILKAQFGLGDEYQVLLRHSETLYEYGRKENIRASQDNGLDNKQSWNPKLDFKFKNTSTGDETDWITGVTFVAKKYMNSADGIEAFLGYGVGDDYKPGWAETHTCTEEGHNHIVMSFSDLTETKLLDLIGNTITDPAENDYGFAIPRNPSGGPYKGVYNLYVNKDQFKALKADFDAAADKSYVTGDITIDIQNIISGESSKSPVDVKGNNDSSFYTKPAPVKVKLVVYKDSSVNAKGEYGTTCPVSNADDPMFEYAAKPSDYARVTDDAQRIFMVYEEGATQTLERTEKIMLAQFNLDSNVYGIDIKNNADDTLYKKGDRVTQDPGEANGGSWWPNISIRFVNKVTGVVSPWMVGGDNGTVTFRAMKYYDHADAIDAFMGYTKGEDYHPGWVEKYCCGKEGHNHVIMTFSELTKNRLLDIIGNDIDDPAIDDFNIALPKNPSGGPYKGAYELFIDDAQFDALKAEFDAAADKTTVSGFITINMRSILTGDSTWDPNLVSGMWDDVKFTKPAPVEIAIQIYKDSSAAAKGAYLDTNACTVDGSSDQMFEIAANPTDSATCVENGKIQLVFEGGASGTAARVEKIILAQFGLSDKEYAVKLRQGENELDMKSPEKISGDNGLGNGQSWNPEYDFKLVNKKYGYETDWILGTGSDPENGVTFVAKKHMDSADGIEAFLGYGPEDDYKAGWAETYACAADGHNEINMTFSDLTETKFLDLIGNTITDPSENAYGYAIPRNPVGGPYKGVYRLFVDKEQFKALKDAFDEAWDKEVVKGTVTIDIQNIISGECTWAPTDVAGNDDPSFYTKPAPVVVNVSIYKDSEAAAKGAYTDVCGDTRPEVVRDPYTDIAGHWAEADILKVYAAKLMLGIDTDKFAPEMQLTRAQLVTILGRIAGYDNETIKTFEADATFPDADHWAKGYIGWAQKNNIVGGYEDGTFKPDQSVTRAEMAKMFVEFFKAQNITLKNTTPLVDKYPDADTFADWAVDYIEEFRKLGLAGGVDAENTFSPNGVSTRAQIATVLSRYLSAEKA